MKIAFYTDSYLPNIDGVVRSIVNFRGQLQKEGHPVFVYAPGTKADERANSDTRVKYSAAVPFPPYPAYKVALFPYVSTINHAKDNGVELVHSHAIASMAMPAVACAKAIKAPLVGTFHTLVPKGLKLVLPGKAAQDVGERVIWKAIKYYYKPFDAVMAPSRVMAKMMGDHGIPDVIPMPNPVDLHKFKPDATARGWVRRKFHAKTGDIVVLVAGRMSFEKNAEVIVKAVKLLDKEIGVKLVVSGEGPATGLVKKEAKGMGNVEFTGFVPERELVKMYAGADLFATASTFETQGLTVLEAMACGTPVAAADSMALPENVKNGKNGALFAPNDPEDAAQAIMKLAGRKKRMRENCVATARGFSVEECTARLLGAYRNNV